MVEFALELPQLEFMMTAGRFSESGFEKSENGTAGGVPEPWPRQKMPLLEGESLTNVVSPIAYALARRRGGGGEFEGALHITNFRIALERTGPGKATFGSSDPSLDWVCFPMGCIKAVTQASEDPLAITVIAKDMRSCRMRFFYHNPLFVSSLTQIMGSMAAFSQTSPEKAFAITHATAVHRNRRRSTYKADSLMEVVDVEGEPGTISSATAVDVTPEVDTPDVDGWLVYDEETEFVRQGVIKPKSLDSPQETDAEAPPAAHSTSSSASRVIHGNTGWRMYHNRSHRLVPTYPLHFVVPAAMSDADVRAVAAYRCKGRLPTVTWMDPQTKAVLARSAQPLAGLGGNSCAEDERLLRLLSRQGRKGLSARTATKPEMRVAEPAAKDEGVGRDHDPPRHPRLRSSDGNLGTAVGSSINTPGKGSNNSGEGSGGAAESESSGGLGGEDIGDKSFLEIMGGSVGMPSWTTPWSITRVNIQQPAGSMEKERHAKSKAEIAEQRNLMKDASGEVGAKAKASGTKRVTCGPKPSMSTTFRGGKEVVGGEAGDRDPELCVLDARTAVSALGNQLVGKGVETGAGYGSSIQLVFSGIGNIHAVKDAFEEMRNSLDPLKTETETRSIVDKTSLSLRLTKGLDLKQVLGEDLEDVGSCNQWSRLLRQILAAGVLAAKMVRLKACSVLVHCSDGWDRTPQICSTVGLLLDPYYRTAEGFCVLIEKDWLSFGHKFWARCMGGSNENAQDRENVGGFMGMAMGMSSTPEFVGGLVKDYEELSPVFIQFLDVVHNLLAQFPTAFEFTEDLLVFVAEHTFSGLFGTFLCDTDRRRRRLKLKDRTVSIWTAVLNNKSFFTNADYTETEEPLWPSLAPSKIRLWERQYWRVPSLRPSHPFTKQVWEDHIAVTIRLLGASNGVPPEGVPREDSEGDGSGE